MPYPPLLFDSNVITAAQSGQASGQTARPGRLEILHWSRRQRSPGWWRQCSDN